MHATACDGSLPVLEFQPGETEKHITITFSSTIARIFLSLSAGEGVYLTPFPRTEIVNLDVLYTESDGSRPQSSAASITLCENYSTGIYSHSNNYYRVNSKHHITYSGKLLREKTFADWQRVTILRRKLSRNVKT